MLDEKTVAVMTECSVGSVQGTLRFSQVLEKLAAIGVESYHADLFRKEKTYYMPSGESHLEGEQEFDGLTVADTFNQDGVRRTVQLVQQGKIGYIAFMKQIAAAGVSQYWVYLRGKKVDYVGRRGEVWTEWFPLS
jgi:uncharacterized protein YbcV (DUF1398 family)